MTQQEKDERADIVSEGARRYQAWRDELLADPEYRKIYEEEAAKSELWLQLVEARQAAGLTQKQIAERIGVSQAQVARIEKRATTLIPLTPCAATLRPWAMNLNLRYEFTDESQGKKLSTCIGEV